MSFFSFIEPVIGVLEKLGINPLATDHDYLGKLTGQVKSPEDKASDLAQSTFELNQKVSQENFDLAKQQFQYQKDLNQTIIDREDNAIRRQIADLRAAGLSPLALSGGASANPLTSANAPQKDISGINQALGNTLSAYNDIFNRKLQKKQFALQSKVQTSQLYNQLMDSKINREYLGEKLKWEKIHGFRDYSLSSELVNIAEKIIGKVNKNSVIPTVGDVVTAGNDSLFDLLNNAKNIINPPPKTPINLSSIPVPDYDPELEKSDVENGFELTSLTKTMKSRIKNAYNIIQTHSNPKDKKLNDALDYVWKNTSAALYFDSFDSFKAKVLGDSKYANNLSKYLKNWAYPAHYFD